MHRMLPSRVIGTGPFINGYRTVVRNKTRFAYPAEMTPYEDDYVEVAKYPAVDYETRYYSKTFKAKREGFLNWQRSIHSKDTVEEKLMEMNTNRAYGWKAYQLTENLFNYDVLPLIKYITRTQSIPESNGPPIYDSSSILSKTKHYVEVLKDPLEEVLKFEMYGVQRCREAEEPPAQFTLSRNQAIANQVTRFVMQALAADEPTLKEARVDYRPKSEAFWFVGGFNPRQARLKWIEEMRKEGKIDKNALDEMSHKDEAFQYLGTPLVQLRSKTPIGNLFQNNFKLEPESPPLFEFETLPNQSGYRRGLRYATNIPGHWSGDEANANFLAFHSAHFLESAASDGIPIEFDPAFHPSYINRKPQLMEAQGILTSFARLLAQAYMLGFDQFGDIGYPLTTQTVVFNGIDWSFFSYQLNTIQLDNLQIKKNRKVNYCWALPPMKLFEETGNLNSKVLEMLLKFFLASASSKEQQQLKPHVKCHLEEVTNDYRREFILYNFHEMFSQRRQDHMKLQIPEIYDWERIYKINHQTRPMDARKRFYMKPGDKPYEYKYNYKNPRYRPKRLHFLEAELAQKNQEKAVEEIRQAQMNRFKIEDNE